jgi:hypothetical protein
MQYILLAYADPTVFQKMTPEEQKQTYGAYQSFTEALTKAGAYKASNRLQPTSTATTVRLKDGKPVTTHGPFAETREALLGYYLIDAKDLDQALGIAARVPSAKHGSIEVRPIMVYN